MPKVVNKFKSMWCCNPFELKKHSTRLGKRKVTEGQQKKMPNLVVGDSICDYCRLKISRMAVSDRSDDPETEAEMKKSSEEEYVPPEMEEPTISTLNKVLTPLGQSPVTKRKLSRVKSYAERKAGAVNESVHEMLNVPTRSDDGEEIISQFKEKFKNVNTANEEYSSLPKSWTEHKIMTEFGVSLHVARTAKITQVNKGIMSVPDRKYERHLPENTQQLIKNFYQEDDISRIIAGMKDTKSVKEGDRKVKKQKSLLLANLKELYKEFKKRNPSHKVGFSSFASLRPKYCVLSGTPGTHNVCVCTICENLKLMVICLQKVNQGGSINMNVKYLVQKIVCQNSSANCYLNRCEVCPGSKNVSEWLTLFLEQNLVDELVYKKWKTVDRADIITVKLNAEAFIHNLIINLQKFKIHNFIAKAQSSYLKQLKSEILPGEFINIGDYSENYSFIIQDAIQGCHWNTSQATIHPFVIYYQNYDNSLQNICFSVISDYLVHDAAAVHLFQKKLIAFLRQKFTNINKIYYFSDGAAGQYKNKKNFINLLHHEREFQVRAEWHFFATSHGKGPSDCVGATIKRLAVYASLQGTHITSAIKLHEWAQCNITRILFSFTRRKSMKRKFDV
ncbi:hypothetical protein C0J52_16667 [Blattella germanica]|nr:hypothetical protein C0J52_16667 [Blattella germanica]